MVRDYLARADRDTVSLPVIVECEDIVYPRTLQDRATVTRRPATLQEQAIMNGYAADLSERII